MPLKSDATMPDMRRFVVISGAIIATIVLCVSVGFSYRERIALMWDPSAARAYVSGMRHFNSMNARVYDIDEAQYFLTRAAHINPKYPYVFHQLARIHFLKAEYPQALDAINREMENNPDGERAPVFYMRGLIEGYMGDYTAAVRDYKESVRLVPERWEARVDYAWVLIKTGNYPEALHIVEAGLAAHPENPWLLSMRATVLHEQGNETDALPAARLALQAVNGITEAMWLTAYPGNAPEAAVIGIRTLRDAAQKNLEIIERSSGVLKRE